LVKGQEEFYKHCPGSARPSAGTVPFQKSHELMLAKALENSFQRVNPPDFPLSPSRHCNNPSIDNMLANRRRFQKIL